MELNYEVLKYSITELKRLFSKFSEADPKIIDKKLHSDYFEEYFHKIGAKTVIVEKNYIDRDFLEDYSSYYVKCFHGYKHHCTRLHFWDIDFNQDEFEKTLLGTNKKINIEVLKKSYLGFIVVKPLPLTIIGRTCLKTYSTKNTFRSFPITRNYEATLYGIKLCVSTLAFQEQDNVVAACATSALWSAFHGTGVLFHHYIPSPVEITKAAVELIPLETRSLPSNGLTIIQMANAIRKIGLEPMLITGSNYYQIKSTIYAYLRCGIPVIAGISLFDFSAKNTTKYYMGEHAIAITGFRLGASEPEPYGENDFLLKASRIDRIYVHDDQVGPFARMIFDNKKIDFSNKSKTKGDSISTSWRGQNGMIGSVRALFSIFLIPLYHKIRIPFNLIEKTVIHFDAFLKPLIFEGVLPITERFEWDIYLSTANFYKQNLLYDRKLNDSSRKEILIEAFPRFIWVASAYSSNDLKLDLVFDATDIEQGKFFVRAVEYDIALGYTLRSISKQTKIMDQFITSLEGRIIEWFSKQKSFFD